MPSIKKTELEELKRKAEECDGWYDSWQKMVKKYLEYDGDVESWKVRTWTAEQEIHDLKEQFERNETQVQQVMDHFQNTALALLIANSKQFEEVRKLQETNTINCERIEQLDVQLAGVSVAALGGTKEPATPDQWGWSRAYQDTLDLRIKYEYLLKQYSDLLAQRVSEAVAEPVHQVNEPVFKFITTGTTKDNTVVWDSGTFYSTPAPDLKSPEFIESQTKRVNPLKKHFSRIAVSLLLLAVLGLGFISYRQNQVIQYQRHVLVEAAQYILQECPPLPSTDKAEQ
jgi:hypothetical protein